MKIALVSPYDFAYPGGVVSHISSLAHHFVDMGHEAKIIAPASKPVLTFADRFLPVCKPLPVPASGSIARISLSINLSSRITDVLDQENFDVVHLHEPLMPMLCTTVLRFSQSVNIGTFHASYNRSRYTIGKPLDGYNFGRPFTTVLLKRWARKLDGKIAVSEPAKEFASKYFSGDYSIIPNGVDVERFSPNVLPIGEFLDGKVNILFVGRLEKRKGLNYLLKAYRKVKRELPNCRLIIVGPGIKLRRKYERQVLLEGIEDVVFVGQVPYDELPRFYKTADVFCAPATSWESFGIVLLEAMAVGKPVVASNVEGYASLITRGVEGLLVPPKDEGTLAQALLSLIEDEPLRQQMGAMGRLKAQDYSWENIARRVLDYYIKISSGLPRERQLMEFGSISPGSSGR